MAEIECHRGVSDRKRGQARERELAQRLARAQRVEQLSIVAGCLAHDLNNRLLAAVRIHDLILDGLAKAGAAINVESLKKDLVALRDDARQAMEIIRNVVAVSRRGNYDLQPARLNEVIEGYLQSLAFQNLAASRPGVAVQTRLSREIAWMRGSTSHLSQVVMNLILNAYDALPDGGKIVVQTANARVENDTEGYETIGAGDYAVLRVKDTGVGMDSDTLCRMFEPFFSRKPRSETSGTGLGLALVHSVVKDHGGFIDVRSALRRGTEFILYFPVARGLARLTLALSTLFWDDSLFLACMAEEF